MSWRMLTPPTGFTFDKKVPSGALGSLWDLERSEGECFQGGGCTDTRHMFYMWKCGEVKLFCTHRPEDEQKQPWSTFDQMVHTTDRSPVPT